MVSQRSSQHFWLFVKMGDLLNLQYKRAKLKLPPHTWNIICDNFINAVLNLTKTQKYLQAAHDEKTQPSLSLQCITNKKTRNKLILLSLGGLRCSYFLDSQDNIIRDLRTGELSVF